jgi:hypothetical protein
MRNFSKFLALAAGLGCAASLAFAADQSILGKSFLVKQNPSNPATRKIVGSGKEKNSSATFFGNPTLSGSAGGAILQIFAQGATSTAQTFILTSGNAPSTGKPFWTGDQSKGFKYKDPKGDNGPVSGASIKKTANGTFSISAKISAKHGTVNVVPPNPGSAGCLALKLGILPAVGDRYNVAFGPPFTPADSSLKLKNNVDKSFKATKPSQKGVCPTSTPTTTTSTTSAAPTTTTTSTTGVVPTTTTSTTTTTTLYGSPSRAFLAASADLLD